MTDTRKDNMIKLHSMIATEAAVRIGKVSRDNAETYYEKEVKGRSEYWKNKEFDKYAQREYDEYCESDNKTAWVEEQVQRKIDLLKSIRRMRGGIIR